MPLDIALSTCGSLEIIQHKIGATALPEKPLSNCRNHTLKNCDSKHHVFIDIIE